MNLTKFALIFLQRPDLPAKDSVKIIKLLMERTNKAVRFAMVVDYVKYYDYLEKTQQEEIIQQLQNMVYFRELIIGKAQISDAGLISNSVDKSLTVVQVAARSKERVLISHQKFLYGCFSILQLQVLIDSGDISLIIYYIQGQKQIQYWKEERTEDRRVNIVLKDSTIVIHGQSLKRFDINQGNIVQEIKYDIQKIDDLLRYNCCYQLMIIFRKAIRLAEISGRWKVNFCSDDDFKKEVKIEITNQNAQEVLKKLINDYDMVLFMKGTPEFPNCGYSLAVVQILKKYGIRKYQHVNILQNPIVRAQLKLLSNWPTFPQLYVKGQLIGGCDIMMQMHKDGTLKQLLQKNKLI